MQTVRETCIQAWRRLDGAGIEDASSIARYIVSCYTDIGMAGVMLSGVLIDESGIEAAVERVLAGQPAQYATSCAFFYGRRFYVDGRVLIPRPETELLCEEAIGLIAGRAARVLDVCTGSGAIAVTIACECQNARVTASDIDGGALLVAGMNAEKNAAAVELVKSDLLRDITGEFDMITANPPYIPKGEYERLSPRVRDREPRLALYGGEDGLSVFRRLIPQAYGRLAPGGVFLTEIGFGQAEEVCSLLADAGFERDKIIRDYAGIERIITAKKTRMEND